MTVTEGLALAEKQLELEAYTDMLTRPGRPSAPTAPAARPCRSWLPSSTIRRRPYTPDRRLLPLVGSLDPLGPPATDGLA